MLCRCGALLLRRPLLHALWDRHLHACGRPRSHCGRSAPACYVCPSMAHAGNATAASHAAPAPPPHACAQARCSACFLRVLHVHTHRVAAGTEVPKYACKCWAAAMRAYMRCDSSHSQDAEGVSPLMRAAEGGHMEVVAELLQSGAPWNAQDAAGYCAGGRGVWEGGGRAKQAAGEG